MGFTDDKTTTSHVGYKKKKDPRKKNNAFQHGPEGTYPHPLLRRQQSFSPSSPVFSGHPLGCECEVCSTEFPLRTHLLIDMSYSRLNQGQATPKTSTGSRFSFFSRKKTSSCSTADHTAATLALLKEQRRISAARAQQQAELEAEEMAAASQDPVTLGTLKQDSLMIPVAKMSHFFPAGHPIPTTSSTGRLRLLEAPEQQLHVVFHMMGHAVHVTPALCSPLYDLYTHHREHVVKAFKAAVSGVGVSSGVLQGMVLVNLERGGEMGAVEFPFMMLWVVDGRHCDTHQVINKVRNLSLEALDPAKTGFTCPHYFDTFEEVAMLARPPLEKVSRKATTSSTGYIITVFRVFEGDDGEKFERNWLGWTGARTMYKSLTNEVGLRRLTLHKSKPQNGTLHYVLLCDCSNFLTCIHQAVKAIPPQDAAVWGHGALQTYSYLLRRYSYLLVLTL
ncbi:hypothetical protein Hamer_G024922 [Homarus americanus]|uniref:DUF7153 domain-containing protein n=1 Tax=Homarus americanus TaxID=6706 RepID=A0A8J5JBH1_HOMAM|nr:hypothetical protein Hamer_G024922 [Homarus americanus]